MAASLANERNHVRTALAGSMDHLQNIERYYRSPFELGKQTLSYTSCTIRYDMLCMYSLIFAERSYIERYERTWNVALTQAVARSLTNKRNHVRNVIPRSVDFLRNKEMS